MSDKDGEPTETVDELISLWTGSLPGNRASKVEPLLIDAKSSTDNLYVLPNSQHSASVSISDPEGNTLDIKYIIMNEVGERSQGSAFEKEPEEIAFEHTVQGVGSLSFKAPIKEGDYRLFVYAYDEEGKLGYSNMPFFVRI